MPHLAALILMVLVTVLIAIHARRDAEETRRERETINERLKRFCAR